jgi:hypothetical protein
MSATKERDDGAGAKERDEGAGAKERDEGAGASRERGAGAALIWHLQTLLYA